jgi:hypothetical protein
MLRAKVLAATLLVALCAAGGIAGPAGAGSTDQGTIYRKYALIRDRLAACSLDRANHHLGDEERARCPRYRQLYTLWSEPGESYSYHVHCNTSKCPAAPFGEPDPRQPIPAGARTFR